MATSADKVKTKPVDRIKETVSKKRGKPQRFTDLEMFQAKATIGAVVCNRTLVNWCYVHRALAIGLCVPKEFSAIVPATEAVERGKARLPLGILRELGRLRETRVLVQQPGFRNHNIIVVTTLLDAEEVTATDLADLYALPALAMLGTIKTQLSLILFQPSVKISRPE